VLPCNSDIIIIHICQSDRGFRKIGRQPLLHKCFMEIGVLDINWFITGSNSVSIQSRFMLSGHSISNTVEGLSRDVPINKYIGELFGRPRRSGDTVGRPGATGDILDAFLELEETAQ
jgi:hypothetical protein